MKRTLWELGAIFKERKLKYAFKVGMSTAMLAAPAFFDATRPIFNEYKGEWALISVRPERWYINYAWLIYVLVFRSYVTYDRSGTAMCCLIHIFADMFIDQFPQHPSRTGYFVRLLIRVLSRF